MDNVKYIDGFDRQIMAVKTDNSLWAWGWNYYGWLGDGATRETTDNNRRKPVKITDNVAVVSTSQGHTLAVKTDGSLWVWGNNGNYQLGDGTNNPHTKPYKLMDNIALKNGSINYKQNEPSSWAAESVKNMIEESLVPGYLQSDYTQPITRAEFCSLAVMLYEKFNYQITERKKFSDTTDVNIEKMGGLGIVGGIGNGKFGPDILITREQAAVMMANLNNAIRQPFYERVPTFNDNSDISSWAFTAVGQVQDAEIMNGVGQNNFAPKEKYTREQSIVSMWKLFKIKKEATTLAKFNYVDDLMRQVVDGWGSCEVDPSFEAVKYLYADGRSEGEITLQCHDGYYIIRYTPKSWELVEPPMQHALKVIFPNEHMSVFNRLKDLPNEEFSDTYEGKKVELRIGSSSRYMILRIYK